MARVDNTSALKGRDFVSIRGRHDFAAAYLGVRRAAGGLVVLSSEGNPGSPQVAFVAGKRVGNAVTRNRIKRRLRAAMTRVQLLDGVRYVVIARGGSEHASFRQLVGWLKTAARWDLVAEENE